MVAVGACLLVMITSTAVRAAEPRPRRRRQRARKRAQLSYRVFRPDCGSIGAPRAGDTAKPQVSTIKKCADPAAEMREKMEDLRKKNCQFTPLRRNEDHYLSSWLCPTASGQLRFRMS